MTLQSILYFQFSAGQVLCLYGQHRVRAGMEVLLEEDRWWTIDLYLDSNRYPSLPIYRAKKA